MTSNAKKCFLVVTKHFCSCRKRFFLGQIIFSRQGNVFLMLRQNYIFPTARICFLGSRFFSRRKKKNLVTGTNILAVRNFLSLYKKKEKKSFQKTFL